MSSGLPGTGNGSKRCGGIRKAEQIGSESTVIAECGLEYYKEEGRKRILEEILGQIRE